MINGQQSQIVITVPGLPKPQDQVRARAFMNPRTGRPQATVYRRKGPTKDYRARVALAASEVMNGRDRLEGPLFMKVFFYVEKPKSKAKRKVWPDVKPDLDNYLKALKDALKGIAYRDDSQICVTMAFKVYAIHKAPETLIILYELMEDLFYVSNEESTGHVGSYGSGN